MLKRSAKRYARELGPRLRQDYGASASYEPRQIEAAAAKLGLPRKYIVFGYAAFLSEATFLIHAAAMPVAMPYDEARSLYESFIPQALASASANPETDVTIVN
ncbi:MAG TPA: DUF6559 family protein [Stellaceae bacterium]|nr:DUF6559 family protein [Stellaceae bacterium]